MRKRTYTTEDSWIVELIEKSILIIEENPVKIFKEGKELTQRSNKRKRSDRSDHRVDICHQMIKKSINVSHLIWMYHTRMPVPPGFEIHHIDENPENNNFNNLVAVHCLDHLKLHKQEPVPF